MSNIDRYVETYGAPPIRTVTLTDGCKLLVYSCQLVLFDPAGKVVHTWNGDDVQQDLVEVLYAISDQAVAQRVRGELSPESLVGGDTT